MSKCKFSLFFISKKGIDSKMVQLEWQNMLMRANRIGRLDLLQLSWMIVLCQLFFYKHFILISLENG